ncbi:putative oxidoreductase,short chain dehydrogenase [Microdochium bolleyi]|uniref:Putative oxidoreductase,short chain dehydrogenase n=1 Tax=Microdochium bolleyi TaxID=196109 RepID=A0A136IJJ4_9PEZI|nr:putative oxidoreductase,short chain dehydrogenase [Microdochium bolleyi]
MSTPKVWIITGCSSGFGKSIALHAHSCGDYVIATARNPAKMDDLKAVGIDTLAFDVTAPLSELKTLAERAFNLHGRIDYLVNNAGYFATGSLEEATPEETQAQFNTNVFGLLNTMRAFLPYMRAARSGVIANFSSMAAWVGWPGTGLYCASKWAATGLSETMTEELKEFGIKVVCIEPGYFRSNVLKIGSRILRKQTIADYEGDTAARKNEALMIAYDGKQAGDVEKGSKIVVDLLTGRLGKDIPVRLILGPDAYQYVKAKCDGTMSLLDEWKDITDKTDLDVQ